MHIAIDARCLPLLPNKEEAAYLQTLLAQLFTLYPQHRFTLIGPDAFPSNSENVSYTKVAAPLTYLGLRHWYSSRLPSLLPQDATAMICINGGPAHTALPQVVFISSLAAIRRKPGGVFSFLYKKYWPRRLQQAGTIATITPLQQQALTETGINNQTFFPVGYAAAPAYAPAGWQQQEIIMETHTGGKAYFLYTGPFSEAGLLLVLRAFSFFKKWQKSNLQLLAAGRFTADSTLLEKLATYKYRTDVKLYQQVDEATLAELTAGAYAVINGAEKEELSFSAAAAVLCGVPIIGLQSNASLQSLLGPAALYTEATPQSLADGMKKLYKDEAMRQELVNTMQSAAGWTNAGAAAGRLWQCLQKAAAKNEPTFAPV